MILLGNYEHARSIAGAAGIGFDPQVNFVISRVRKGQLLGGVVYTNNTGRSVQMHIAGFDRRWLSPHMIWTCFDFPFNALRCEHVVATIPSTNHRSINICFKFGFEHITSIPNIVRNGDMEIFMMARQHCPWLELRSRFIPLHEESTA